MSGGDTREWVSKFYTLDRDELMEQLEAMNAQVRDIQRFATLLVGDLERGLDADRGKPSGPDVVSLTFQRSRIGVTLWLCERA